MVTVNSGQGPSSYATIYTDGFHDMLSRYWPEPREQLHAGGWRKTRSMLQDIKRLTKGGISRVLDLCCGEGGTATYVAATEGWEVTGVDIVESAVKVARARANEYGTVVRVNLSVPEAGGAPVCMKLSYDTVVRMKLATDEGESAVRLSLSYDTVVRVSLSTAAAAAPPPPLAPIHLDLTYDTAVRVKLAPAAAVPSAANGTAPAVSLKLSYDQDAVLAKLTEGDGAVQLALSYGPGGVRAQLAAEAAAYSDGVVVVGVPAVRLDVSYKTDVHARLAAAKVAPLVTLKLSYQDVGQLVDIVHASIHSMPLPSNAFDVVYGQDPDGLVNEDRVNAFKEVLRVLRPGGLFLFWHHWIPGPGWPAELLREYWTDPITGSSRLSYECYLEDLQASGLQVASVSDCTPLALAHLRATAARMRAEAPGGADQAAPALPDKWLERTLQFAERGGTMGIEVVAYKPE